MSDDNYGILFCSDILRQDSGYMQPVECTCSSTAPSNNTTSELADVREEKICRQCHKSLSTLTVPTARGSATILLMREEEN